MGFRNYIRGACPEGIFGDGDIEEDSQENNNRETSSEWQYSLNGYCEKCDSIVYNDNGTCPDCHQPTKEKHHWYKKV